MGRELLLGDPLVSAWHVWQSACKARSRYSESSSADWTMLPLSPRASTSAPSGDGRVRRVEMREAAARLLGTST
ncbi:hypothetical protein C0216_18110 [Streptomyces globosus]|uniref:Uncharacterized protein n=1 Tax=Streptomyces globosus TaxID=68209 RepID=A0A344U2I8_9ACTN|nr:hypothetical protein C0216_18110 [Streptomyces globosus]